MKTLTIQIGNSDDKLTQVRWSQFIFRVSALINVQAARIHFFSPSPGDATWQNAAWVFEIEAGMIPRLILELTEIRVEFDQTAIAITEGETIFI